MRSFGRLLARARTAAGFPTAYRFYHGNGGRRYFPFTYMHYLRLEKGAALPRPAWLSLLLPALRLSAGEDGSRELFVAYLKDTLETEEAYQLVVEPLLCRHSAGRPAGGEALRWMKAEHSIHLTPEQFRLIASDETVYWCSELLLNDRGLWTAEELAKRLGAEPAKVRDALAKLKRAKLLRETAGKKFGAKQTGKFYTFPGRLPGLGASLETIQSFWEKMYRKGGKSVFSRVELVRAPEASMRNYSLSLADALDAANAHSTHQHAPGTGFFVVEARIRKLLDH